MFIIPTSINYINIILYIIFVNFLVKTKYHLTVWIGSWYILAKIF